MTNKLIYKWKCCCGKKNKAVFKDSDYYSDKIKTVDIEHDFNGTKVKVPYVQAFCTCGKSLNIYYDDFVEDITQDEIERTVTMPTEE